MRLFVARTLRLHSPAMYKPPVYAGDYHRLQQAHVNASVHPAQRLSTGAMGETGSNRVYPFHHSVAEQDEASLGNFLSVPLGRGYWHRHPCVYTFWVLWSVIVLFVFLILLFYNPFVALLILLICGFVPCGGNVVYDLSQRNSHTRDYWRRNDKDYQRRKIEYANWMALPPERLEDAIRLFRVTHNYVSFEAALAHFHLSERDYLELTRARGAHDTATDEGL
jgi:hypothetical protein